MPLYPSKLREISRFRGVNPTFQIGIYEPHKKAAEMDVPFGVFYLLTIVRGGCTIQVNPTRRYPDMIGHCDHSFSHMTGFCAKSAAAGTSARLGLILDTAIYAVSIFALSILGLLVILP